MSKSHPRRRGILTVGAIIAAIVVLAAAGLPVYVFPATSGPGAASVVDVIGPPTATRMKIADRLLREGLAGALVVTVSPPLYGQYASADIPDCHERHSYPAYCVTPTPFTTQGESRELARLAAEHGWDRAIVITQTSHIARAGIIMAACSPGRVEMVADRTPLGLGTWAYQYLYQTAGFIKLGVELLGEGRRYCD